MDKDEIKMIDCFGDICPIPMVKIEQKLSEIKKGEEFIVVVDHSCTIEAIKNKYLNGQHEVSIDEVMNGVWEIYFKKT